MAELNIIKGTIKGRLGEITGQVWKGKPVIKAAIFSKAPPTNAQTQSVRAFEALNRIASTISRLGFQYLGITAKNIHNHNAVAKWLKPAVRGNAFTPSNIQEIIPQSDKVFISRFIQDLTNGFISLSLSMNKIFVPPYNTHLFTIVFDDTGRVHWSDIRLCDNFSADFRIDTSLSLTYSILSFLSIPKEKTYITDNFIYHRGADIQGKKRRKKKVD